MKTEEKNPVERQRVNIRGMESGQSQGCGGEGEVLEQKSEG